MKIILSRKGFDSSVGEIPSPIFSSSDEMCSLPIPDDFSTIRYKDIMVGNHSLGEIVNDLTRGKKSFDDKAHLDPDLNHGHIPRLPNWKPIFGPLRSADTHLQNCTVEKGDIFLFFGWFRKVEKIHGRYQYVYGSRDLHVIFGWLQIENRIRTIDAVKTMSWIKDHPHVQPYLDGNQECGNEILYISTDRLHLPDINKPGGGIFKTFNPLLCLTAPEQTKRSIWKLPSWFYPFGREPNKKPLSYHSNPKRWTLDGNSVLLQSASPGQEFVLDCDEYPEAINWLSNIMRSCS